MIPSAPSTILHRKSASSKKGFTLVEVLVVIVIIAVLALLVMFLTRRARNSALQANALTSLRQVAVANMGYSTENNGDIPVVRDQNDPRVQNGATYGSNAWFTNSYWGSIQPYLCADAADPSASQTQKNVAQRLNNLFNTTDIVTMKGTAFSLKSPSKSYPDTSGLRVPFAFNMNDTIYKWGDVKRTSGVSDASKIIYMAYGSYRFGAAKSSPDIPYRTMDQAAGTRGIWFTELRNALVSYLDGHVEVISAPVPSRKLN